MLGNYRVKETGLLINLISRRIDKSPNFALLIGAGASVSSGVKPACEMIDEWRSQLYKQSKSDRKFDDWLNDQDWYDDEEEYSILFKRVYDKAAQRRNYIEECVKNARPSWGYIYLSSIISQGFFNITFTPNFDDLLNEACYAYADCKPIVCAHDSAVGTIRVTSARPKIIKLHGDFLYDSIKNTVSETESLEKNMRDKFVQFAEAYGLIVVGYRGNDRSIMDVIDTLVRTEGYFPHGVYWCLKKGSKPCRKLDRLLNREGVFVVEIEGFDEFMAELHQGLALILPDSVGNPYKATTDKLNRFVLSSNINNEVIRKDIAELQAQIKRFESLVKPSISPTETIVPYEFLAQNEYDAGRLDEAIQYYEKAANQDASFGILYRLATLYRYAGKTEKAVETGEKVKTLSKWDGFALIGVTLGYIDLQLSLPNFDEAFKYAQSVEDKHWVLVNRSNVLLTYNKDEEALSVLEEPAKDPRDTYAQINKSIALKRLGRLEEAKKLVEETLPNIKDDYHRACAYAVINNKEKALEYLKKAIQTDKIRSVFYARRDPDFEDYRDDPDFKALLDIAFQPKKSGS
jgi:tetratricopeptide (TPR) repeat protein